MTPEPTHAPDHLVVEDPATFFEEDPNNGPEVCDPSDNEEGSVIEEEAVIVEPPIQSSQNKDLPDVDPTPEALEDAPKKSYASIVRFFFFLGARIIIFLCQVYFCVYLM